MEKRDEKRDSKAWLLTLLIGIPASFLMVWHFFERAFDETPVNWALVGEGIGSSAILGIPVIIASLILWFMRHKKLPSFATFFTLIVGGFFLIFSTAEFISGLGPNGDITEVVGGLLQILVFSLPFLVISWLLWTRPKIGAILLTLVGIAMGVWMIRDWARPEEVMDWMVPMMVCGLPIVLGLFTFIREQIGNSGKGTTIAA